MRRVEADTTGSAGHAGGVERAEASDRSSQSFRSTALRMEAVKQKGAGMPEWLSILLTKLLGAFAGGALSLAFMTPKNAKDAALRIVGSLFFGTMIAIGMADFLEKNTAIALVGHEKLLTGAFIGGFIAWPILGRLYALASKAETHTKKDGE